MKPWLQFNEHTSRHSILIYKNVYSLGDNTASPEFFQALQKIAKEVYILFVVSLFILVCFCVYLLIYIFFIILDVVFDAVLDVVFDV